MEKPFVTYASVGIQGSSMVELRTVNAAVEGSSPSLGAISENALFSRDSLQFVGLF